MADNPPALKLLPTALTSLAAVSAWLEATTPLTPPIQNQLTGLINSASRLMFSVMSRNSFLVRTVTERRTGDDMPGLMLREWPVLSISSVTINGVSTTASDGQGGAGYVLDPWDGYAPGAPQLLSVVGGTFPSNPGSTVIVYEVGYAVQDEVQTVGSTGYVWPLAPQGRFAANWKVLNAAGSTMTAVSGTPSVGQYVAPTDDTTAYQFNPAQGQVTLNYSFIPADIDYACAKWVGEWYRYKARIGQRSQSASGQVTNSFVIEQMPADVKLTLQQYSRILTV